MTKRIVLIETTEGITEDVIVPDDVQLIHIDWDVTDLGGKISILCHIIEKLWWLDDTAVDNIIEKSAIALRDAIDKANEGE